MTDLPTYEEFLAQDPSLWPHLPREAYEILCDELRDRVRSDAHDAAMEDAERAEIMEQCYEEEKAEDRARHPEFSPSKAQGRIPYDETDEEEGVFNG